MQTFKPVARRKVDISDNTMRILREGLERVDEAGGTAHAIFKDFDVKIASKTGTAQNAHGDDHALFAAYAPAKRTGNSSGCYHRAGRSRWHCGRSCSQKSTRCIFYQRFSDRTVYWKLDESGNFGSLEFPGGGRARLTTNHVTIKGTANGV